MSFEAHDVSLTIDTRFRRKSEGRHYVCFRDESAAAYGSPNRRHDLQRGRKRQCRYRTAACKSVIIPHFRYISIRLTSPASGLLRNILRTRTGVSANRVLQRHAHTGSKSRETSTFSFSTLPPYLSSSFMLRTGLNPADAHSRITVPERSPRLPLNKTKPR